MGLYSEEGGAMRGHSDGHGFKVINGSKKKKARTARSRPFEPRIALIFAACRDDLDVAK